jgi:hypothetical protein
VSIRFASREAADKLLGYLALEYDADGVSRTAPNNIQYYYKLPAVFAYGGRRELAYRLLEQFVARFMRNQQLNLSSDPVAYPWTPYLGGWAAWGAGALGRFDIAHHIMGSVVGFRDSKTGGYQFLSSTGKRLLDVERTGAALMGAVWSQNLSEARSAARFLRLALECQPAPDREFHAYVDPSGKVAPDTSDRNAYFSFSDPFARPALFATGISGLVWLGRAASDEEPFALAQAYMRVVLAHHADPGMLPLATKLGWSALMLSAQHNQPEFNSLAIHCAHSLIKRQNQDGSINFDQVPDVSKPIDKLWLIGWGCDCALTLMAVADGTA